MWSAPSVCVDNLFSFFQQQSQNEIGREWLFCSPRSQQSLRAKKTPVARNKAKIVEVWVCVCGFGLVGLLKLIRLCDAVIGCGSEVIRFWLAGPKLLRWMWGSVLFISSDIPATPLFFIRLSLALALNFVIGTLSSFGTLETMATAKIVSRLNHLFVFSLYFFTVYPNLSIYHFD